MMPQDDKDQGRITADNVHELVRDYGKPLAPERKQSIMEKIRQAKGRSDEADRDNEKDRDFGR